MDFLQTLKDIVALMKKINTTTCRFSDPKLEIAELDKIITWSLSHKEGLMFLANLKEEIAKDTLQNDIAESMGEE